MLNIKSLERYDACYATRDFEGWMISVEDIREWAEAVLKNATMYGELRREIMYEESLKNLIEHCKNE